MKLFKDLISIQPFNIKYQYIFIKLQGIEIVK